MICLGKQPGHLFILDAPCEISELVANTSSIALIHQNFHSGLCLVILYFNQLVMLFCVLFCISFLGS